MQPPKKSFLIINSNTLLLACFLTILLPLCCLSQDERTIDSLKKILKSIPENNKIKRAVDLIALGQQYVNKSAYALGMDCYQQSMAIAQSINNDSLTANCYKHMAIIAFAQQNYYRDSVYDSKALSIYRKLNDKLSEGRVLKDIGSSYLKRGNFPQAKKYYDLALPIFKQLNQQQLVAGIYSGMAVIYKNDY